jgi:hypothetical protein
MKKILPRLSHVDGNVRVHRRIVFCLFFLFLVGGFLANYKTYAAGKMSGSVTASGQVGQYHLNVSGYISPYASIIMTSDGVFIRATVADRYGMFSFLDILIKRGFSHFCLDAIDFKRLGESYTCFKFKPATGDITMTNIFLPPTLGLSRTEIAENSEVTAYGYTMPGAKVVIHLSNGKTLTTVADKTGYYEFKITGLKAGKYELFATANYNNKESLTPDRKVQLRALSPFEQVVAYFRDLWNKLVKLLTSVYLNPLWLIVPILIFIIILIIKIWPERFTFIYNSKLMSFIPWKKKKKRLHHDWFIGY